MYDLRQLSALNGTLPTQQNPAGVTAQLVDLLAMQKVEEDKKAAARALAIAAGQANMPTVAQSMEQQALNSARGEIAQKLGLAGLMQQQAPQGPQSQEQRPPAQGIASAPSPLPESYQEGGIVAFAGPDGSQVQEAETFVDALGIERDAKTGDPIRSMIQRLGDFRNREQAKAEMPGRRVMNAADEKMLRTAAPESIEERPYVERDLSRRQPGIASLAGKPVPPVVKPAAGLADAAKANLAAVSPQVTTPVLYNPNSFTGMAMQNQKDVAALKPEDAYAKGKSEYQTEIGEGLARDVENQKARIAGIQALYDRQARERPSNFMRGLQLMGKNTTGIGLGGAFEGVSEGIDKTNAGYTTQDIANQTAIDGLNAAMEKARQSNDIGRYGAAKTARDAILTRQAEAKKELGPLAGYEQQAATSKYTAELQAKTSRAVAALQEQASDRRFTIQEQNAAQQRLIDTVRSIDADLKSLETEKKAYVGVVPTPENKTKMAELDTAIANARALKQQIMGSAYAKQGVTVPAAAPTIAPPPSGAVRLKQKG
jgi:hypothetical protein